MSIKYVCAVGDSFVFGAELVTTYFKDEFKGVSHEDYVSLEFSISKYPELREKYDSLLDSMRFSNLIAKNLGAKHINFAQGGASQEAIKFQAHLLMQHLKENNIDPKETLWLVGLTMQHRRMMLNPIHEFFHKMQRDRCGNDNYLWSRYTCATFFGDRTEQPLPFTSALTKELITATSETQVNVTWVMNTIDTANLLKANGVEHFYFLNMFLGNYPAFKNQLAEDILLTKLMDGIDSEVLPSRECCFQKMTDPSPKCAHGHPNKEGHERIAQYILSRLSL